MFGGAFAPIHNGHLRIAIEAREQYSLDRVLLMPTPKPPHRRGSGVSVDRRAHWVQLAVADEPGLEVDLRESRRNGPSYSVDTLSELRDECPGAEIFLLIGSDSFNSLHCWYQWQRLAQLVHLLVALRQGDRLCPVQEVLAAFESGDLHVPMDQHRSGRWSHLDLPPMAVSSSEIRSRLRAGRSIRGLVSDAVIADLKPSDLSKLIDDE